MSEIKTILDELKGFDVQEYEIRELIISRIRRSVANQTGVWVDVNQKMIRDTIKQSSDDIITALKQKYGDLETARLFYEFKNIRGKVHLNSIEPVEMQIYEYGTANLIYMLRYAISGNFDKDYAEVNSIIEANKLNSTLGKAYFMINNISITAYKNGKVVIKGLNQAAIDRIKKGFEAENNLKFNAGEI